MNSKLARKLNKKRCITCKYYLPIDERDENYKFAYCNKTGYLIPWGSLWYYIKQTFKRCWR